MSEPSDDLPPEHVNAEIEMGVEEFLGRPLSGKPEDRIDALHKRIAYLQAAIESFNLRSEPESEWGQPAIDARNSYRADLTKAQRLLKEWQTQRDGRN